MYKKYGIDESSASTVSASLEKSDPKKNKKANTMTIQKIDYYEETNPVVYATNFLLSDARFSRVVAYTGWDQKNNVKDWKWTAENRPENTYIQYWGQQAPVNLLFVAPATCHQKKDETKMDALYQRGSAKACRVTFDRYDSILRGGGQITNEEEKALEFAKSATKAAIRGALLSMIRSGTDIAIVTDIGAGGAAGPWKNYLTQDFYRSLYSQVLDEIIHLELPHITYTKPIRSFFRRIIWGNMPLSRQSKLRKLFRKYDNK